MNDKTTHFGFQEVPINEKTERVDAVFHSVANKYDLMNDIMSFGLHRLWKRFTILESNVRPGQQVLDIAGGTGDLTKEFAKKIGNHGLVVMADINFSMLSTGRERLLDSGIAENIFYVQADAENLPFQDNYFDCLTIAFGLRNVTNKEAALSSFYRVLKPGGKCLILEFSHPISKNFNKLYELYSFNVIPKLGELICKDKASYQYLVESIKMHPDQDTLKKMLLDSGFEDVVFYNLTGGIVALHKGFKY